MPTGRSQLWRRICGTNDHGCVPSGAKHSHAANHARLSGMATNRVPRSDFTRISTLRLPSARASASALRTSAGVATVLPATSRMTSPAWKPKSAAGPFGSTSAMTTPGSCRPARATGRAADLPRPARHDRRAARCDRHAFVAVIAVVVAAHRDRGCGQLRSPAARCGGGRCALVAILEVAVAARREPHAAPAIRRASG